MQQWCVLWPYPRQVYYHVFTSLESILNHLPIFYLRQLCNLCSQRPTSSACYSPERNVLILHTNLPPHTHIHALLSPPLCPGGYTPRSSLPSFIRRTLIFSLMSVSCRSGQKQSSAGAITTSRGIPQNTLLSHTAHTHTHTDGNVLVLLPSGMERSMLPPHSQKMSEQTNRSSP